MKITESLKNVSIDTMGDEHLSRAIQERLFLHGFEWGVERSRYKKHDYPQIDAWDDGEITDGQEHLESFKIITIEELFKTPLPKKETITIGGKSYDKDEFEEAVKDLKPVK